MVAQYLEQCIPVVVRQLLVADDQVHLGAADHLSDTRGVGRAQHLKSLALDCRAKQLLDVRVGGYHQNARDGTNPGHNARGCRAGYAKVALTAARKTRG